MRSANGRLTISGLRDVLADVTNITKVQPKEEELGLEAIGRSLENP